MIEVETSSKAADMEIPIVISRTSPTSLSLRLAQAWGITLFGYVRGHQMRVYTAPWRVELPATAVRSSNTGDYLPLLLE